MGKIVGKIFFLILLFSMTLNAQLKIQAFDADGSPTQKVIVGEPFSLEVALQGSNNSNERPHIDGLEKMYVRSNGLMITTINGKTTTKYKYSVRIDIPGRHNIGPAHIMQNGSLLYSNTLSIKAVEQATGAKQKHEASTSGGAFLRLTADKEKAVIGEPIKFFLRFYYGNEVVNLAPITQQPIPGFDVKDKTETSRGVQTINGKDYNFLEIQWVMHATESGKKLIPAYAADFTLRSNQQSFMGHLSMFLSQGGEQKKVYSNSLNIQIDPLPHTKETVHAIGVFSQFNARITPQVAKEGEGMVLTLELEGEGNLNQNLLSLELPEHFKFYDSKNYSENTSGASKHYFEFIVQGLQKGDWEIPAQHFCFFDIKSRSYKILKTLPITLTILPSQGLASKASHSNDPMPQVNNVPASSIDVSDDIQPLNCEGAWQKVVEVQIPWWLYFLMLLIPPCLFFAAWLKNTEGYSSGDSHRKQKTMFKHARTQLEHAIKSHNIKAIYGIFIELFSTRYALDSSQTTQEFIVEKLSKSQLSNEELSQWQDFFNQMSEHVFFMRSTKPNEHIIVGQYARRWIDRLEQVL
jgi:hypothetical protein